MSDIPHPPEDAFGVETFIEQRRGQWVVSIAVAFADGVVRHEINTYRSQRRAEVAASWIKRAAQRDWAGLRERTTPPFPAGLIDVPEGPGE